MKDITELNNKTIENQIFIYKCLANDNKNKICSLIKNKDLINEQFKKLAKLLIRNRTTNIWWLYL